MESTEDVLPVIQEEEDVILEEEKQIQMKRFLKDVRRASRVLSSKGASVQSTTTDSLNLEFELLRLGYTTQFLHEVVESLDPNFTLEDWVVLHLGRKEEVEPEEEVEGEEEEEEHKEEEEIVAVDLIQCSDLPFERLSVAATYAVPDEHHGVYSLQHSMDGSILAIGHGDGSLAFVSTVTGKLEHETRRNRLGPFAVMCIRFSPKEQHICLVGTSVGRVYAASILDAHVDELLSEHSNEINCLDFCLDGSQFATAGKDLNIRLYDTNTAKVVRKYEGYSMVSEDDSSGHAQRVFSLKFHTEIEHIMITGGWDNHLKIWDVRTPDGIQRTISGPHLCGDGLDIKGHQVLTGSWVQHNALQVWDYGEGQLIQNVPFRQTPGDQGEFLYCAQFCDNNVVMAGGSGTSSVQAINLITNELVGEIKSDKPIQALDTTIGGRMAAMGGSSSDVILSKME